MALDHSRQGFATRAIHAGQDADPATGATVVPIYATSTYTQEGPGRHKGYEYSRSGNPTRTALETCLAALESGERGLAFASGLAATTAVLSLLKPGDEVLAASDLYGGTYRLLERVFKPWGLVTRYTDDPGPAGFARLITPATRLVWIETPTNPLLQLLDIAAVAEVAHGAGALLAVDNTFASPYLQQPLRLGADLVVHSTTKYLARRQMRDFGGMISIRLKGGGEGARRFLSRTKLFSLAESLGGVESLVCHPATMTHASIPADVRSARGVDDGLVRLSAGIEDADDLQEDLQQGLA